VSTESVVPDPAAGHSARGTGVSALPATARSPLRRLQITHPGELMDKNTRTLAALLDSLTEVGARHALIGGLVAGHYGKGRATVDVDLLVPKRFMKRLQAALERRGYEVRTFPDMMRVYVSGEPESVADLVVQEANPVLRAAFAATTPGAILGLPVSVVRRGAFVALKFHAAVSPTRQLMDKMQDVVDIGRVLEKEFGPEDERLAVQIAGKMYPGAVADLEELIDDVRHGRRPKI
jgi:hypothetical protein